MEDLNYETKQVMSKTFFWMFLGLLGTAIMAWYTYSSGMIIDIVSNDIWAGLLIGEVIVVLLFSLLFKKLSPTFVGILYFIYAMINGITLSTLFVIFELNSIINLFIASAAIFGILAFIGYKTEKDISDWRNILTILLIVGIILSFINIFVGNSVLDLILDWVILFTFFGVTVYDMNTLKTMQGLEGIDQDKVYIYCAMQLYLDFINIFLRILSLFGKRRD